MFVVLEAACPRLQRETAVSSERNGVAASPFLLLSSFCCSSNVGVLTLPLCFLFLSVPLFLCGPRV